MPPPPLPTSGSPGRRIVRRTLVVLALVLVVGIGIARVTRPARFSGEPMDHWLDSLGSLDA